MHCTATLHNEHYCRSNRFIYMLIVWCRKIHISVVNGYHHIDLFTMVWRSVQYETIPPFILFMVLFKSIKSTHFERNGYEEGTERRVNQRLRWFGSICFFFTRDLQKKAKQRFSTRFWIIYQSQDHSPTHTEFPSLVETLEKSEPRSQKSENLILNNDIIHSMESCIDVSMFRNKINKAVKMIVHSNNNSMD